MASTPPLFFFFSLLLAGAALSGVVLAFNVEDEEVASTKFSYSGPAGPDQWGSLSASYSKCSTGKMQSPVNIVKKRTVINKKLKPVTRDYKPANATLVNWSFNLGVQYEEKVGGFEIDGKRYNLKQMHWHTPSEHLIEGRRFPAELHMVHKADDQSVAVVGILFKYGKSDAIVSKIMKPLTELAKQKCSLDEEPHIPLGKFDTKPLKKNSGVYYRYIGSLTTPPCTENVTWTIIGNVRSISKGQVEALRAPLSLEYKNNSRPAQPLNSRKIELYYEPAHKRN